MSNLQAKKSVFISGVSRGIGEKMARFFLDNGWQVFGVSRAKPHIQDSQFVWQRCDITKPTQVQRLHLPRRTRFDCIIYNAAIGGPIGPALDIPLAEWKKVFDANFFSHLEVTRHILPRCRSNACFIFLSGRGAVTPRTLAGPYALSKLAVAKLAEQLSLEYRKFRFYAMAPGAHDTRMHRGHLRLMKEPIPQWTDFKAVERLLAVLVADRKGRLNGRLIHVRDNVRQLLSLKDGGYIRRIEKR